MIRLALLFAGLLFALPGHAQFEGVVESKNLTSDMSGAAQRFEAPRAVFFPLPRCRS